MTAPYTVPATFLRAAQAFLEHFLNHENPEAAHALLPVVADALFNMSDEDIDAGVAAAVATARQHGGGLVPVFETLGNYLKQARAAITPLIEAEYRRAQEARHAN